MSPSAFRLILASQSPRRRELLADSGFPFAVVPSRHVEECFVCSRESPAEYAARLAYEKAREVVQRLIAADPDAIRAVDAAFPASSSQYVIIGCDTIAECQGEVLGKPHDEGQARRMLQLLSGREHRVLSGLCVWPVERLGPTQFTAAFPAAELRILPTSPMPQQPNLPILQVDLTTLRMDALREEQLAEYLSSGQWEGKAGAFGYQDRTGWLHVVAGSESNVVGLPLELLARMLCLVG